MTSVTSTQKQKQKPRCKVNQANQFYINRDVPAFLTAKTRKRQAYKLVIKGQFPVEKKSISEANKTHSHNHIKGSRHYW